jgi:hypothetical protein
VDHGGKTKYDASAVCGLRLAAMPVVVQQTRRLCQPELTLPGARPSTLGPAHHCRCEQPFRISDCGQSASPACTSSAKTPPAPSWRRPSTCSHSLLGGITDPPPRDKGTLTVGRSSRARIWDDARHGVGPFAGRQWPDDGVAARPGSGTLRRPVGGSAPAARLSGDCTLARARLSLRQPRPYRCQPMRPRPCAPLHPTQTSRR